jgi:hypothetical protein
MVKLKEEGSEWKKASNMNGMPEVSGKIYFGAQTLKITHII